MNACNMKTLTLISIVVLLFACSNADDNPPDVQKMPKVVKTQTLEKFSGYIERHITGRLQAADTTSISFEVSGVVKEVYINLGESFVKGTLLAQLDPQIYQLAVNQRASLLAEAKAGRIEAKQNLDRNLSLKKQNLVSQAVVDNAQAAFDIANQRVNSAQSALNIDKENLSDTKLYAPYNGTISARLIEPSQQVNPQMPAFTIQGNANLEISAAISESLIGKIELGEAVKVRIPALDINETYSATLTEIGTQASIGNAFPITITFLSTHNELMPGMSAEVILPIKEKNSAKLLIDQQNSSPLYAIPLTAMATDAKGQYVQIVIEKDQRFFTRQVHFDIVQTLPNALLARLDIDPNISVQVLTAGADFVQDNQEVQPLNLSQQIYNQ